MSSGESVAGQKFQCERFEWVGLLGDVGVIFSMHHMGHEPPLSGLLWSARVNASVPGRSKVEAKTVSQTGISFADLMATENEVIRWNAAARIYSDEVSDAATELIAVWARWRRYRPPIVRDWLQRQEQEAEQGYLQRVRNASVAYRPVHGEVTQRLEQYETQRQLQLRQKEELKEAKRAPLRARFEAWRRQQDAIDAATEVMWGYSIAGNVAYVFIPDARPQDSVRLAPNGRALATALLELEKVGVTGVDWAAAARESVEEMVGIGNFSSWWERIHGTARNLRANDEAVKTVAEAFTRTSQALEAAGRPGLGEFDSGGDRSRRAIGWKVIFDWSMLGVRPPAITPPPLPADYAMAGGDWYLGTFERDDRPVSDVVLTAGYEPYFANNGVQWFAAGEYRIGETSLHTNPYQRIYAWEFSTPAKFAEGAFRDEMIFIADGQAPYRLTISGYAEPEQYIPYVRGLARVIAESVLRLVPAT
ncbi:MAG TPA: hypothetical protein DGG94_00400 [Micromonosporaceae bacterium]|nr:hypothetical protein [Micromonosporaceae bacterium]HCU48292.1 hypothetical protein [Micromonosporaceae bacterium]